MIPRALSAISIFLFVTFHFRINLHAFSLRRLLISVILGSLPLASAAQGSANAAPRDASRAAGTGLASPAIGNTNLQRQQRTGRRQTRFSTAHGLPTLAHQQTIQDLRRPPERSIPGLAYSPPAGSADLRRRTVQERTVHVRAGGQHSRYRDYSIGPGDEIMIRAWGSSMSTTRRGGPHGTDHIQSRPHQCRRISIRTCSPISRAIGRGSQFRPEP